MDDENYMFREARLLRDFDRALTRVRPLLVDWIGAKNTENLISDARLQYEALVPRIPFIGKNNPLLLVFLPTPQYLAVYRALQAQDLKIEHAGYLTYEIGSKALKSIPSIARRFIGHLWFSSWFKDRLKRRALNSHLRQYPGNFVLDFVESDGKEFDFGVDYIECASCKFLDAENAMELAPYICAVDMTASELLGWGLSRTMTLADGSNKCDFRFKKGGITNIDLPQSLQTHLVSS